jgi:signal transduction histidine kinase/ligand-binding sensor domain-containing protein
MKTCASRFLCLVLSLSISCFIVYASDFSETQTFYCIGAPGAIFLADVNGDGFSDLIVGTTTGKVVIHLNSGFGYVSLESSQVLPVYAYAFATGDFDGDGITDLAAAQGFGGVSTWLGNGDGTFRYSQALVGSAAGFGGTLLAADLDGDGLPDLISTRTEDTKMLIFMNNGKGGFAPAITNTIPLHVNVAVRHVPDSAEMEIDVLSVEPSELNVWRKAQNGWVLHRHTVLPPFSGEQGRLICGLDVSDVDGDGVEDLTVLRDNNAQTWLFSGNRRGGFEPPISWTAPITMRGSCLLRHKGLATTSIAYGSYGLLLHEGASNNAEYWSRSVDLPPGSLIKAAEQPDGSGLIVTVDFYGFAHVLSSRKPDPSRPVPRVFDYADPRYNPAKAPALTSRVWSVTDGLPGNAVRSIVQTSDGYIWVGTTEGLARFDGDSFRRWGVNSNGTVFNRSCEALAEDPLGRLWVGYLRGLMRIEGNSIAENYVTNLTDPRIFSMKFSREGDLWIGEFKGVDRLRNGVFEPIFHPDKPGVPPYINQSIALSASNTIIFSNFEGIFSCNTSEKLSHGKWLHSPLDSMEVTTVAAGTNGEIYAGDIMGGMSVLSSNGFHAFFLQSPYGLAAPKITALACRKDGSLWIGRVGALFVLKNGEMTKVSDLPELSDAITALYFDREDNLWVGTESHGVVLLRFPSCNVFTWRDGLLSDTVNAVAESETKTLWVATTVGVFTNSEAGFKPSVLAITIPPKTFDAICFRQNGEVWVSGPSGYYQVFRNEGILSDSGWGYIDHVCYTELKNGDMLMVSDAGVRWCNGWPNAAMTPDFGPGAERNAFEDSKGNIWLGTLAGIFHLNLSTHETKLLNDKSLTGRCEVALEDAQGALWIISDQGLVRFKNGRCSPIRVNAGLFEENILSMVDDGIGNYWFGSNQGIFRVASEQLNEYADGKSARVDCIHYGLADGMLTEQCSYGHPSAIRSRDGRLWFATMKGLVQIDPKKVIQSTDSPKIFFDEISDEAGTLFSRFAPSSNDRSPLKHLAIKNGNERSLSFQFSSPRFSTHGTKPFEYRMNGLEKTWTQSISGKAAYNYLPPGDYAFEVRASTPNGLWSPALSVPIHIKPLLTQRRDFYLVSGTLCLGFLAIFGAYRQRIQNQMQILRQKAAVAEERSRIARDLHDDIGASLTQIAMASDQARSQLSIAGGAGKEIDKVSQLARNAVENMSQIIWSTNAKFDTLSSLIAYLREFASNFLPDSFHLHFQSFENGEDIHVSSEFRRNVFYILKEALANVLKHSCATSVTIQLLHEEKCLRIIITDNGKGFTKNERMLSSTGLDSMRKRAADLHGKIEIISNTGQGTTIHASFPLP